MDYVANSLIVTVSTTLIVTVISMMAAYGISLYPFRGGKLMLLFLLATRIIPPLSLLLPFYLVVSYFGLVDTLLSMIIANIYLTYPFAVLIMKAFFDNFPREIIESAIVDGCSRTGALFRIVLPVGAPGIASAGIITFLWTWNEFIYAFVFTSTPKAQPVTVGSFDAIGDVFVHWRRQGLRSPRRGGGGAGAVGMRAGVVRTDGTWNSDNAAFSMLIRARHAHGQPIAADSPKAVHR